MKRTKSLTGRPMSALILLTLCSEGAGLSRFRASQPAWGKRLRNLSFLLDPFLNKRRIIAPVSSIHSKKSTLNRLSHSPCCIFGRYRFAGAALAPDREGIGRSVVYLIGAGVDMYTLSNMSINLTRLGIPARNQHPWQGGGTWPENCP